MAVETEVFIRVKNHITNEVTEIVPLKEIVEAMDIANPTIPKPQNYSDAEYNFKREQALSKIQKIMIGTPLEEIAPDAAKFLEEEFGRGDPMKDHATFHNIKALNDVELLTL
mgnify:CR=1 FL=1|tara:strand:- start:749 stop:1084 length:336 start_codon:yes stop_codon:yes gene_type:complete